MGEFLSDVASAGELGFGKTLSLVFLMMRSQLGVIVSVVCAGGDRESGDMSWPGTTICMAGVAVTINNMVYCSGVNRVDKAAMFSAASAQALLAVARFLNTSPIFAQTSVLGRFWAGNMSFHVFIIVAR